jgi:signal transduction histidine kinase
MPMIAADSFFRQITDSFSHLIFLYNAGKKRIVFSNRPHEWLMGDEAGRYESPPFLAYVRSNELDNITKEWHKSFHLKKTEVNDFTCPLSHPDGRETNLHFHATGVTASDGSAGILFSVDTISGKDIKRLNRLIDQSREHYISFIDTAAHDLLSPLRKLSVLADRLVKKYEPVPPDAKAHVERIESCIDDIRSLVNGLAELAVITTDPARYTDCNMQELLRDVIKEVLEETHTKDIVIDETPLPVIEGHRDQLSKLFRHIVMNAVLFNKSAPKKIMIRSGAVTEEERVQFALTSEIPYCRIEVSDNGIGFHPDDAEKIFEPFIRLNGKSAFPGNGLGLAVARRIAENHGGVLYARGEENAGATFIIILPEINN